MFVTKQKKWALVLSLFILSTFQLSSQSMTLRYEPGYCNKVVADISNFNPAGKLYTIGNGLKVCSGFVFPNTKVQIPVVTFQLQKQVGGNWVNQGSPQVKTEPTTASTYRDLQYGEIYRVTAILRFSTGVPLRKHNSCDPAFQYNPLLDQTISSNPLEIERYEEFTNSSLSGNLTLTSPINFGGNGSSFATQAEYCLSDVQNTDVPYDVSGSFGADHWVINLNRTNQSGWAGGDWHDYESMEMTGNNIDIFSEGWLGKYGSGAIWPGQYTVSVLAYQDCDSQPWAIQSSFFEIHAAGSGGCRLDIEENNAIDVVLYPNPSSSGFVKYYTIGENMTNMEYSVFTSNGRFIEKGFLRGNSGEINVSNLSNGMYSIIFKTEKQSVTSRLTIIK